ncbi:MAG: hypothetical protein COX57_08100 [Alphaproteobacteria bacterium CG_4_10_14_0_2_um_filter_63_37]|nr:MAG: hypothetical protein AUJ55_00025 [Proteobacteria bacterium CG1_02_64_396]PJA24511.1 MAG: hypothetical protein COX57_08100 [Alphaproteobacteria bacterium CG_4_10_14_0_2_um_filter_63_37]
MGTTAVQKSARPQYGFKVFESGEGFEPQMFSPTFPSTLAGPVRYMWVPLAPSGYFLDPDICGTGEINRRGFLPSMEEAEAAIARARRIADGLLVLEVVR